MEKREEVIRILMERGFWIDPTAELFALVDPEDPSSLLVGGRGFGARFSKKIEVHSINLARSSAMDLADLIQESLLRRVAKLLSDEADIIERRLGLVLEEFGTNVTSQE